MKKLMVGAIAVALLFVAVPQVETRAEPENILRVPADYPTIQAAIDAAFDSDTVLVADGTYTGAGNKDLDFGGKAITVKSENGAVSCIIDCESSGRGFYFHSGETAASILDGFTVRNGRVSDYGAIRCDGSSPTITNCIVTSNSSNFLAGGILCNIGSNPVISNCEVTNNHARVGGGGIYCFESNPTVVNCLIAGNTAESYGGGVYSGWKSKPVVTNCTIADNSVNVYGGGVFCNLDSHLTLNNTTLWANKAGNGHQAYTWSASSLVTLNYCDYADNTIDPNNIRGVGTVTPNNCISEDPLFVGGDPFDYHVQGGSSCIDAGSNALVPAGVTTDLDGKDRIVGDAVDIGAYEYQVPDTTPPEITINSPVEGAQYNWTDTITVDFAVQDPESGIKAAVARIDCHPVEDGQEIPVSDLGYGNHFMLVKATNNAGLEAQKFIIFHTSCEPTDMEWEILDYVEEGLIATKGIGQSLIGKVEKIDLHTSMGDIKGAIGKLGAFVNEVDAQAGRKIDTSIVPSLQNWANFSTSTLVTAPELPQTLTYALEPSAYVDLRLPNGTSVRAPIGGEFTFLFETTEDANVISFSITDFTMENISPIEVEGHTVNYTSTHDPGNLTTGTINLRTGLVKEHIVGLAILEIDGITTGPFEITMDAIGVQRWPDIYTARMIVCGQGTVPEEIPFFGGSTMFACADKRRPQIVPGVPGKPAIKVTITSGPTYNAQTKVVTGGGTVTLNQAALDAKYVIKSPLTAEWKYKRIFWSELTSDFITVTGTATFTFITTPLEPGVVAAQVIIHATASATGKPDLKDSKAGAWSQ